MVSIDNAAITRKAMPVQNKSPPVRKYTKIATRIAGISTRNILMSTIIIKPIMISAIRKPMSNPPSPKLLKIE